MKMMASAQFQLRMRLISGLILFAYVLMHFTAHIAGLISLDALSAAGRFNSGVWRFSPMSWLLYGALGVHIVFSVLRLINRASLRMRPLEVLQLVFGFSLPFLLALHVAGTRWAHEVYGLNDSYAYVVLSSYVYDPVSGIFNSLALVAAWAHAAIGLHMWLRFKSWYSERVQLTAFAGAIALPILSLLGFVSAGRFIAPLSTQGEWLEVYYERLNLVSDDLWQWLATDASRLRLFFVVLIAAAILARLIVGAAQRSRKPVTVAYADGPVVSTGNGSSLLDISRLNGIPHASVCGGRGRCSTCRVKILEANPLLPPPDEDERKLLERINAPDDVRLACQLRPIGNVRVARLLPADTKGGKVRSLRPGETGEERTITVLFADLRNFTNAAESRLPFDVVYLINQFSVLMGEAIEANGGRVDKFLGDGVMALFGISKDAGAGAADALNAARLMFEALATLNSRLQQDLPQPLRMGVGIHTGPVILGDMGYGHARGLTAIGDTVNTASRLEAATKMHDCLVCISGETAEAVGLSLPEEWHQTIEIRGKSEPFGVYCLTGLDERVLVPGRTRGAAHRDTETEKAAAPN